MDLSWCGPHCSPGMLNIGPLALIASLLARLAVCDIIDRHLPGDPQLEYSHAEILTLLPAARLAKPTALLMAAKNDSSLVA